MEDVRLLLLIAALLVLAGFLEIINTEAYVVASSTSVFAVILAIALILLAVFVIWKRYEQEKVQKLVIERGSKEAISALASKIETIKNILENKISQKNYNLLKRELKEVELYKAYLPKILGEKSSEFLNLMNEILESKKFSKTKAAKQIKKLKEILE